MYLPTLPYLKPHHPTRSPTHPLTHSPTQKSASCYTKIPHFAFDLPATSRRWFKAWREDLDARSEDAKASREGRKADDQYRLQLSYFKPLFQHLEQRNLNEEIKVGKSHQ